VFSLVVVSTGTLFCTASVLQAGKRGWAYGIGQGILLGVSTFVLTQLTYINCSSILNMPVSLHTTSSKICAMSLLGPFGGGSMPRMLVAFAGLIVGFYLEIMRKEGAFHLGEILLPLLAVTVLAFIVRYFVHGFFVDHLLYIAVVSLQERVLHASTDFFFNPARGIVLCFAGFVLLGVLPRMGRVMRIVVLCISSLFVSWGMMRVGNMQIAQSAGSIFPGLIIGISLSLASIAVNLLERNFHEKHLHKR
jgi:hypothetical protein